MFTTLHYVYILYIQHTQYIEYTQYLQYVHTYNTWFKQYTLYTQYTQYIQYIQYIQYTVHTVHTLHTVHTDTYSTYSTYRYIHMHTLPYIQCINTYIRMYECVYQLHTMVPCSSLPTCSKHLFALMKENFEEGPIHIRQKPRQNPPPTITPQNMGTDFRIEDVNTLELARQLTLICSQKFRDIRVSCFYSHKLCFRNVCIGIFLLVALLISGPCSEFSPPLTYCNDPTTLQCHDLLPKQQQTDTAKYITELQGFSEKV